MVGSYHPKLGLVNPVHQEARDRHERELALENKRREARFAREMQKQIMSDPYLRTLSLQEVYR